MMIHKILEDDKTKLHNLCITHISNLSNVASVPGMLKHFGIFCSQTLCQTKLIIIIFYLVD